MVPRLIDRMGSGCAVTQIDEQSRIDDDRVPYLGIRIGIFGGGWRVIESLGHKLAPIKRLQDRAEVESSTSIDRVSTEFVIDAVVQRLPADGVDHSCGEVIRVVHIIWCPVGHGIEAVDVQSRWVRIGNDRVRKWSSLIEVAAQLGNTKRIEYLCGRWNPI